MPEDGHEQKPPEGQEDPEEVDEEVRKKAYPLSEGSNPVEIEGREISKIVLYPHGAPEPQNNNELAILLTKKESELEAQKKLNEKLTEQVATITAEKVELEKKVKEVADQEKAELAKELSELREKAKLDKIEKIEELSADVLKAKIESIKELADKEEQTPGTPQPKTKKELEEANDKAEQKKKKRLELFGHEDELGKEGDA